MMVDRSRMVTPASGRPGDAASADLRQRPGAARSGARSDTGPRRCVHRSLALRRGPRPASSSARRSGAIWVVVPTRGLRPGASPGRGRGRGCVEGLGRRDDRLGGDVAVGFEDLHPLVGGSFLHTQQDAVAGFFGRLGAPDRRAALELFVDQEFAEQVDRIEERIEEVLEQVAALDPLGRRSCAAGDSSAWASGSSDAAAERPVIAFGELARQGVDQVERHQGLQQAGLDRGPDAGLLSLISAATMPCTAVWLATWVATCTAE